MPAPVLSLSPASPLDESVDAVILFARTGDDGAELLLPPGTPYDAAPFIDLTKNAVQLGASGRAEEVTCLPGGDTGPRIFAIVGVGKVGGATKTDPAKPRMPRPSAAPPVPRPDSSQTLSPLLSSLRVTQSLRPLRWKVPRSVPTRTPNIVPRRSPPSRQSACVRRTMQQPSVLIECAPSWLP